MTDCLHLVWLVARNAKYEGAAGVSASDIITNTRVNLSQKWINKETGKHDAWLRKRLFHCFYLDFWRPHSKNSAGVWQSCRTTCCTPSPFIIWAAVGKSTRDYVLMQKTFRKTGIDTNLDTYDEICFWTVKQGERTTSCKHFVIVTSWIRLSFLMIRWS